MEPGSRLLKVNMEEEQAFLLSMFADGEYDPAVELATLISSTSQAAGAAVLLAKEAGEKREVTRVKGYVELVVPNYTDCQFKQHFRLDRSSFEVCIH